MIICKVNNEATGKESVLHAELLKVFKNQKDADLAYSKFVGNDFKEVFGDWVAKYKGKSTIKTGETYDTGEPKLKLDKETGQRYFELLDGTAFFIDKKGLRGTFTPQEIKDVSKYLLYRFVQDGGAKSFNEYTGNRSVSRLMESIEKSIADYKVQASNMANPKHTAILTRRIEKVELHKEDFKRELIYQLDSLGQKFKDKITDGEGNLLSEVTEENKGGGINIVESISVNPKSSATVNTKIFLSQLVSQEIQPDGTYKKVLSKFLLTPTFEDFSEVWETLQPMLSDQVATQSNDGVISSYRKMKNIIDSLKEVKPWAKDLSEKLEALYNDNSDGRYKVFEFVQAFNKNKINYYVTEFNELSSGYTVYNATSTNSRESQILDRWGFRFQEKWLNNGKETNLSDKDIAAIDKIKSNINEVFIEWKEDLRQANGDIGLTRDAFTRAVPKLFQELRDLGVFGLKDKDVNALVLLGGGTEKQYKTLKDLFTGISHMISDDIIRVDREGNKVKFTDNKGSAINPFRSQKMLKTLAKAQALRELDIAESSILASGGKTYFAYSNPTYISNKISEWKNDPSGLEALAAMPINAHSKWLKYLLANHITNNEEKRKKESIKRLDALESGLASSFTSVGKDDGVDNTSISLDDQLNDNITKLLGGRLKDGVSYFPSIIAADKSRRVEFKGFEFVESGIHNRTADGSVHIPPQTVDIFVDYFEDEYNRMRIVAEEIENLPGNKKIKHYHTGNKNGLKSQLFPEFSHDVVGGELKAILYKDGLPLKSGGIQGFDSVQRVQVFKAVKETLKQRHSETQEKIQALDESSNIDRKLIKSYKNDGGIQALTGDFLVNGLISSIEYTKLFSGDPAYYKSLPDLIKRIPATYTDGLQLALESSDDMKFNIAIVKGVEVTSKYIQKIKDSLTDKDLARAYEANDAGKGGVNTTDAQAWITPDRWKFLKQRLGQWSAQHDVVFNKMKNGKMLDASKGELKLAAQPLKGVYFEINNGVPTYLKYSQAVLIPSMVKGTPMEALLYKMTHDKEGNKIKDPSKQVHEVITEDGIKVGAISPTKINEGNTTSMAKEFELNTNTMSNKGWKLQQDLPIKSMHETNIGSQIQKNILEGLKINEDYLVGGVEQKGTILLQKVHNAISNLVDIGAEEVSKKLNIDSEGKINDSSALYRTMISEFRERGGNENIIAALEKRTPFDAIPQIRGRIDSILMSVFNRAMIKISTEGGSYIQVSPFGLEQFDETSGIIKISDRYDGKGLQPPREGKNGQTLPGQVMIPHTLAMKLLEDSGQNLSDMTPMKWRRLFKDPKTRELVGYRIPNQGMSSNDTLEIVGILPATMGDSIIGYDAIPAKTGSDFDIDKMYIMAPNMLYNKKTARFEVLNDENKRFYKGAKNPDKLVAQNTVLNLYSDILQSHHTYDNMMTSIDTGFLKKDVEKLHPKDADLNLDLFSPITQLETKMNYMSGKMGVALTANQLVDHVANQSLDIRISESLGMGNTKGRSTIMDENKPGTRSIADTLSAFLNAYVDIANDPYVTRGNHNDITANVSFMLIRAGVSMERVNRYIGQPILKELVELKKRTNSITSKKLTIEVIDEKGGIRLKNVTPYGYLRNKYNIGKYKNSHLQLININNKGLEKRIKGEPDSFIDSVILNAFEYHEKKSAQWTEAVLAAKVDTRGAGGSPISMNIAVNKINKVIDSGFVLGFKSKFKGTALGAYERQALIFTQRVLNRSNIVLSGTRGAEEFMNTISGRISKDKTLVSEKLGKAIDKGMYTYMISGTEMMRSNRVNFKNLFEELPLKIAELAKNSDNFLLKELEIQKRGNYNFIGINPKNKPALYQNDIYRGWMDLYEDPKTKDIAVQLVKYAYSQSGFSANLNQFFTHIPHEILKAEGMNLEIRAFFQKMEDMATDDNFIDQFLRHESENTDVVPTLSKSDYIHRNGNKEESKIPHAFGVKGNQSFLEKYKISTRESTIFNPPLFITISLGLDENGEPLNGLYKLSNPYGDFVADMDGESLDLPVYIRTHKLGYKAGKNKVFEYHYDNSIKNSILPENNKMFTDDFNKNIANAKKTLTGSQFEKSSDITEGKGNEVAPILEENFEDSAEQEMATTITPEMFKRIIKEENITKKDCKPSGQTKLEL
jgi:hypothetical protein